MPDQHPHLTLAGIPIRVEWSFWLIAVLLGIGARDGWLLVAWVAIVFVSVLVHELGHAVALRVFDQQPRVVLHAFGGLTYGSSAFRTRGQSIAVSAAGPLSAFALLGVPAYLYLQSFDVFDQFTQYDRYVIVHDIAWVNIAWSVLNLLPILPLDGGNIAQSLFGRQPARILSIVVGVAAGLLLFANGITFAGFFFLFFAASNFGSLQQERAGSTAQPGFRVPSPASTREPFTAAGDLLVAGNVREGVAAMASAYAARPAGPTSLVAAQQVARAGASTALASVLLAPGGAGPAAVASLQAHLRYANCHADAAMVGALLYADERSDKANAAFDVACALARAGNNDDAVLWLRRAIVHGFSSQQLLDGEPDLATLRLRADWPEVRALAE